MSCCISADVVAIPENLQRAEQIVRAMLLAAAGLLVWGSCPRASGTWCPFPSWGAPHVSVAAGLVPARATPAWLSTRAQSHHRAYPLMALAPLACWCHRVAPCSTTLPAPWDVHEVHSGMSLPLPATNRGLGACSMSACGTSVSNFF